MTINSTTVIKTQSALYLHYVYKCAVFFYMACKRAPKYGSALFLSPFFFLAAILLEAAKKCLQVKTKEADVPPRAITVFRIEIKL